MKVLKFAVIMLAVLIVSPTYGQLFNPKEDKITAKEHINKLKDGTLVIRMRDRVKQREAMEISKTERQIARQEKKWSKQDRAILDACSKFTFAKPVILRTSEWDKFVSGDYSVLMDFDGKPVENVNPEKLYVLDPYEAQLVMRGVRGEGFNIRDKNGVLLEAPFPYYTNKGGEYAVFLFFKRGYDYTLAVTWLENKFIDLYKKDFNSIESKRKGKTKKARN